MQVKRAIRRQSWMFTAFMSHDRELAKSYLGLAEKWAELIEETWKEGEDFGAAAVNAHIQILGGFSTFDFYSDPCDFLVLYLEETWIFGTQLRQWYSPSS